MDVDADSKDTKVWTLLTGLTPTRQMQVFRCRGHAELGLLLA